MSRDTLWVLKQALYGTARLLGDVQAFKRGQLGQRLARRIVSRLFRRIFR